MSDQLLAEADLFALPRASYPLSAAERSRRYRQSRNAQRLGQSTPIRRPPSTSSERSRSFRKRRTEENPIARREPTTDAQRSSCYRARQRNNLQRTDGSTAIRDQLFCAYWLAATAYFQKEFLDNAFGSACSVCERLWFANDLKVVNNRHLTILDSEFGCDCRAFKVCGSCKQTLDKKKLPPMSVTNGFRYPPKPQGLPELNPISERLISPRIPFMQIRHLQRDWHYRIIGQVINVPVDVDSMVKQLPRSLDNDFVINVALKRKLFHKSTYLAGGVRKQDLKAWLEYLINQPLYKYYDIRVDWSTFDREVENLNHMNCEDGLIENIPEDAPENVPLIARQQTLLWNEEHALDIAPGQTSRPLNLLYDHHCEELSFPQIYYGVDRFFKRTVRVTPYMIASSEIRRKDRRGASPQHILYMVAKILRIRVVDCIRSSFRCVSATENITRSMIENEQFLEECVEKNLSFLRSIPNSSQYWLGRKHDLFAMIRQLGKPTMFLTLSASETNWPHLLSTLISLSDKFKDRQISDPIAELDRSMRSELVNEDPVTCCIYFNKLVEVILRMLSSKQKHNPFGKYRVLDHFIRIEFQHRGSPHAHIMLWMENDPKEPVSEDMPRTIQLITDLCSVNRSDVNDQNYQNQVHRHTFTCTKRGEESCRFHIPFWPIRETRVLLPLAKDDGRRSGYLATASRVKKILDEKVYSSFDLFLEDTRLSYDHYLDIIRASIARPTLLIKREPCEKMTNAFNPWIASILNSNMDLQFILDEYSCASYVVDYVNKSNRGISNLHRELIKMSEENPELTRIQLLKQIGKKVLNSIEMSAPEAAWTLLRQSMSEGSRIVVYIPTCLPNQRHKSFKTKAKLSSIEPDSTDIWTKNIIQKYEERPSELNLICLADFVALYTEKYTKNQDANAPQRYSIREKRRVIRYRNFDSSDTENFKREMVTLYIPFRNELADVLNRKVFLSIYSEKLDIISEKRKEYEKSANLTQILEELKRANEFQPENQTLTETENNRRDFVASILDDGRQENFSDFNELNTNSDNVESAIRRRQNVMEKSEFCKLMRLTNRRQREIILEIIHRIKLPNVKPLQIFLTGPAGSGKTFTLKLAMESVNRFSESNPNEEGNFYLACASTGKAAVNLGATTVHSAFHITQSRRAGAIAVESLYKFRAQFRKTNLVIVDEVSMIGDAIFHQISSRLQQITGKYFENFGAMPIIFCGDFKQLPPVLARPVYKGSRNHLQGNALWQSLDYFHLDQVMRQSDKVFSDILTKIGNGERLSLNESQLIESRFRTEEWCDANLAGVTRLYHQNFEVQKFNDKVLRGARVHLSRDEFSGYSSNEELAASRGKLFKMTTMESSGLLYALSLKVGYPYMVTSNIDVTDGLVNGAIGMLKFIECPEAENNVTSESNGGVQLIRVWLDFNDRKIGAGARSSLEYFMRRHHEVIESGWTPITTKRLTIDLGGSVKCKRTQLPLTPACAITIHKSQGGTFDKVVVSYDKNQANSLIYVGLSRVTSMDGLYLINSNNDFTFHHKNGNNSPSLREIRDEYERLKRNELPTLTESIRRFIGSCGDGLNDMIIATINAQSLVAHSKDIETDDILCRSDFLVITETWMNEASEVSIDNFQLVSRSSHASGSAQRTAGGVAIYKNKSTFNECTCSCDDHSNHSLVGDVSSISIMLGGGICFTLAGFYIHPRSTKTEAENFIKSSLDVYMKQSNEAKEIIVTGDFNFNILDDDWIVNMMNEGLDLTYVNCDSPTTLRNTKIDLTFVHGLNVTSTTYVAYFSDHRPLLNKLCLH